MLKQKNIARTQRDPAKMNVASSDENAVYRLSIETEKGIDDRKSGYDD